MIFDSPQRPIVIAGPCSVGSANELRIATEALIAIPQITLIRVGVWKPRTRPGTFAGAGIEALAWMQTLGDELGATYCCEVASPDHVEQCLRHGIHTMWIGARTTTNPFMVEELCEALRGTHATVMVKNPVCPDVSLWIGAVERLNNAGITDIAAIHRGFNMYNNRGYRNAPLWEVAMEFRRTAPQIPILCDPSHMGGSRDLVAPLSSTAMQLAYDGLMVEVHPSPDHALSDANQQIDPAQLAAMLSQLQSANASGTDATDRLLPLREQIDDIDHQLLSLLSRRLNLARDIAAIKREQQIAVYQQQRWQTVLSDRIQLADMLGLDPAFTSDLMEKIHSESVRVQLDNPTLPSPNTDSTAHNGHPHPDAAPSAN